MKKPITIFTFSILMLTVTHFSVATQSTDGYSAYQKSDCYKGIEFCTKKGEYNQFSHAFYWYVKFRNRYNQAVSFDYVTTASNVRSAKTTIKSTYKCAKRITGRRCYLLFC